MSWPYVRQGKVRDVGHKTGGEGGFTARSQVNTQQPLDACTRTPVQGMLKQVDQNKFDHALTVHYAEIGCIVEGPYVRCPIRVRQASLEREESSQHL